MMRDRMMRGRSPCAILGIAVWLAAAPRALAFTATYHQEVTHDDQTVHSTVFVKDDWLRIETVEDGQLVVYIRRPDEIRRYIPDTARWTTVPSLNPWLQPLGDIQNYWSYLEALQAERLQTEILTRFLCDVYRYTPPRRKDLTVTAWIWRERQIPLKAELNGPEGQMLVEFHDMKLGAVVPQDLFLLPDAAKPEGADMVEASRLLPRLQFEIDNGADLREKDKWAW